MYLDLSPVLPSIFSTSTIFISPLSISPFYEEGRDEDNEMHRVLSSRWLHNAMNIVERPVRLELPVFLCPTAVSNIRRSGSPFSYRLRSAPWSTKRRCLHTQAEAPIITAPGSDVHVALPPPKKPTLPYQCRGCGALSQTSQPNQPGYFDLSRKVVQKYLGTDKPSERSRREDKLYEDVLSMLDPEALAKQGVNVAALGFGPPPAITQPRAPPKKPLCDRCHFLMHNHTGESIYHPSIESICDTLLESPYKYNHVYHVLDAADFPLSLLPKLSQLLDMMPLRSRNRRSRAGRYYHGQKTEMSFIITRADLLAPTKPQVDALFPYLREVLRDALGRLGEDVRLGNLRAVSAKRGWWTNELKEDIWKRGGAGWMVGKANVGKSQLFEAVFPKGRMSWQPSEHQITVDMEAKSNTDSALTSHESQSDIDRGLEDTDWAEDLALDQFSLLPPAPEETQFPEMPLVSDLPGTTASPIRVPFGNGRGELIDLPGLSRTSIEEHVEKKHRLSLLMQSRIVPEQMTLKPGQSLLLGGMIRITPREPSPVMLSYAFTPIEPHVCRTDKAISIQLQTGEINIENIAVPGTGEKTKLAGSFELKWDVTKQRTGPLTRKNALGLDVETLPYRVVSADILIEGVGWVEISAQVRTKDLFGHDLPVKESPGTDAELHREPMGVVNAKLYPKPMNMEDFEALAKDPPKKEWPPKPSRKREDTIFGSLDLELRHEPKLLEESETLVQDTSKKTEELVEDTPKEEPKEELVKDTPQKEEPVKEARKREDTAFRSPDWLQREPSWPIVDVYSPEGKYIACRPPMNGWMLNKPKVTAASRRSRPPKSMKGAKKLTKQLRREREQDVAHNKIW
ncbi:hypothetical protein GGR50DRAFT_669967 [Xylaria sp. CBS 124048]|nr:hypothetical protein GGR50DRAFT_669967 [Xylaria sp. CBS 124048]